MLPEDSILVKIPELQPGRDWRTCVVEPMGCVTNILHWMEQDPHVFRYAWFLGRGGISTDLIGSDKKTPTLLGKIYANMSSYDSAFYHSVNTRIEAEHYIEADNFSLVESTDTDGQLSVGYTQQGTRLAYQVEIPDAGDWTLALRHAGEQNSSLDIYSDNVYLATLQLPATGGWTAWQTQTTALNLPAGRQTVELRLTAGGCDLNWISLSGEQSGIVSATEDSLPLPLKRITPDGRILICIGDKQYDILGQPVR